MEINQNSFFLFFHYNARHEKSFNFYVKLLSRNNQSLKFCNKNKFPMLFFIRTKRTTRKLIRSWHTKNHSNLVLSNHWKLGNLSISISLNWASFTIELAFKFFPSLSHSEHRRVIEWISIWLENFCNLKSQFNEKQ